MYNDAHANSIELFINKFIWVDMGVSFIIDSDIFVNIDNIIADPSARRYILNLKFLIFSKKLFQPSW